MSVELAELSETLRFQESLLRLLVSNVAEADPPVQRKNPAAEQVSEWVRQLAKAS